MTGDVVPGGQGAEDDQSKPESFRNGSGFPEVHVLVLHATGCFCVFHRVIVGEDWSRRKRQSGMKDWSQLTGFLEKLDDSIRKFEPDLGAR